jgi:hypothetical protein
VILTIKIKDNSLKLETKNGLEVKTVIRIIEATVDKLKE